MALQTQEQPQTYLSLYEKVLFFLVALTIVTSGLSALENVGLFGLSDGVWRSGWLQNFSTEMFGAALTLVLIGRIIGEEDRRREREANAQQLDVLRDAVTKAVTEEMRRIQQANAIARLQAAKDESPRVRQLILDEMKQAKLLEGAHLADANLQRARLRGANLQGADLFSANLEEATLSGVNLQGANLIQANLQGANLLGASLQGVELGGANLQSVKLVRSKFDDRTTLPDDFPWGKRSFWTPDTDMARFTDPDHPDFWRSDDPDSPAYWGDAESA